MRVLGIVPGTVVEYLDRGMKRRSEVLARIEGRVPKLILTGPNGIAIEREDRCTLYSVRMGDAFYDLGGDLIE